MDAEKLFWSRPQVGWTLERTFISSGKSLLLTSFVALQASDMPYGLYRSIAK